MNEMLWAHDSEWCKLCFIDCVSLLSWMCYAQYYLVIWIANVLHWYYSFHFMAIVVTRIKRVYQKWNISLGVEQITFISTNKLKHMSFQCCCTLTAAQNILSLNRWLSTEKPDDYMKLCYNWWGSILRK